VSCKTISKDELDKTIPVRPPRVNKKINPITQYIEALNDVFDPYRVINHLKTLIPVGTAITIVAAVK